MSNFGGVEVYLHTSFTGTPFEVLQSLPSLFKTVATTSNSKSVVLTSLPSTFTSVYAYNFHVYHRYSGDTVLFKVDHPILSVFHIDVVHLHLLSLPLKIYICYLRLLKFYLLLSTSLYLYLFAPSLPT